MKPEDVLIACHELDADNVVAFCKRVGISRPAYYRAINPTTPVTELTAFKVRAALAKEPQR
jgi:ACT domain-containing protein